MKRYAFIAYFVLSQALAGPLQVAQKGKFASGRTYELEVEETPFVVSRGASPDDGSTWGIDGGFPNFVVQKFILRLDAKQVWIPRKPYLDLTNLSDVSVLEDGDTVVVTVHGGDAAGSFSAELHIKDYRLVERLVRMGEFPDEVWERTEFHDELWNNPDM